MLFSPIFIITTISVCLPGFSSACSENEIDAECVNPCNTCEQKGQCDPPPACQQGCDCKYGFFRDENGYCVPEQQCQAKAEHPKCPKNALYLSCCPSVLPTCENPEPEPEKDSDDECVPGCACKPGFLARRDHQCVTPDHCDPGEDHGKEDPDGKCPKNAIFIQCGSPCPPTCDDMQPQPCEEKCVTACYCKPGYLVRKDGVCVKPVDCHPRKKQEQPQRKCPENAIFIECGSPCPPTCENRLPEPCEEKCIKACYCKPGFLLKIPEGKCVKPEHCNTTHTPAAAHCPENEEPSNCVVPCNDCKIKGNCQFFACNKGCDCKKGYFRDKNGKCILESKCPQIMPPKPACKADEQYYECTPSCRNTCENFIKPAARCYCGPPGCFCKEGLLKRADGKCVPRNQCQVPPHDECGADQTFYNCTPSCKGTCEHFFHPGIRCDCGPPGCFCKEGLVKGANGKCIPPDQCHAKKPVSCPENAEFSACGPTCRPTCSDPYPAPCAAACVKGCFCKAGFVQDREGRCVRLEDCSTKCLRPAEEFQVLCGSICPDTCENRGRPPPGSCPYRCVRGCFCRKGLYRTKSGHCVPLKDCDDERHLTTTSKPTTTRKSTVTTPSDCHGCPHRAECAAYCKTLGDFIGLCTGEGLLHCRCA